MNPIKTTHEWLGAGRTMFSSGMVRVTRPDHTVRWFAALRRWGRTPATGIAVHAGSFRDRTYLVDELGELTFGEVDARTGRLANALAADGVRAGDCVALMCRNHRYFVESLLACSKLGVVALLLNTDFAAPQLADVLEREAPVAVIHDEEFEGLLGDLSSRAHYVAWSDGAPSTTTLEQLIERGAVGGPPKPREPGRVIVLSSGTTGTPKGVRRAGSVPLVPLLGVLDRIPLKAGDKHFIVAPMFHGWGLLNLSFSLLLGSTVVLRRRFDPETTLATIQEHRPQSAPMVPVMLQRILELPPETRARYDTGSLTALPLGGSAVPGGLPARAMDEFGDILYNLYGSTEVALASTATPADLRSAPECAGRPLLGAKVMIVDDAGDELPSGVTGRVFVGSSLASEGYSGGGQKDVLHGLMSSGDLGHFDAKGRLFIDGRDDDMIVSGGENVFPREVEDLLTEQPEIVEAAVIGVPDEQYGQRLRAFVVRRSGAQIPADAVKQIVKQNLARYKVPRDVVFLDELPRNPTGKILKRELAQYDDASGDAQAATA